MNEYDLIDGHFVQTLNETLTSHYVRSTVLGGAIIADIGNGDVGNGEVNVYANGVRIASREYQ